MVIGEGIQPRVIYFYVKRCSCGPVAGTHAIPRGKGVEGLRIEKSHT